MGNSYRIRATPGKDQNLTIKIDQDFELLEILSLKIRQSDVYTRMCADTGVIAGRVFANNGYGIPNAKVSVFIPITDIDLLNPNLSAIYPYKNLTQVNEDGYAYNILPYVPSYPGHVPTGTFPTRPDVLTNETAIKLYDDYYKFTVKTNDSGDFMIYGVPVGTYTLVLNIDLSDIGQFSLGPQDLVRMGMATEEQIDVDRFKSSENFKQLPQIVVINKVIEVVPFWGEEEICQVGITRADFDITNEANINIQPTAIFMGSLMSSSERTAVKPTGKQTIVGQFGGPRKITGQLCKMIAGPGEIIALRQTIDIDSSGLPIIERAKLPNGGKCIDGDGTWLIDIPMNLDYVYTDEFGNQVLSDDPTVGVPTKAKYRFKIKWQQSKSLSEDYKRGYWLVPNIREKGWELGVDPMNLPTTSPQYKEFQSSYAFSYDWSAYTWDTANVNLTNPDILDAINCIDTFYEFNYNKVYTVSMFMDNYRIANNRQRFLAIKRIDDDSCDDTVNRYPVNDGYFNATIIWRMLNILIILISYILFPLLFIYHILAFVYNVAIRNLWRLVTLGFGRPLKYMKGFSLPMITYPDCEACDCGVNVGYEQGTTASSAQNNLLGVCKCYKYYWSKPSGSNKVYGTIRYNDCSGLVKVIFLNSTSDNGTLPCSSIVPVFTTLNQPNTVSTISITPSDCCDTQSSVTDCQPMILEEEYENNLLNLNDYTVFQGNAAASTPSISILKILAGYSATGSTGYALPISSNPPPIPTYDSNDIPFAERINLFNTKSKYYDGLNQIEVLYEPVLNSTSHFDNVVIFIVKKQFAANYTAGTLFTFVSSENSLDPNVESDKVNSLGSENITGTTVFPTSIVITYADPASRTSNIAVTYNLPEFKESCDSSLYIHKSDIEYFQVITGITIGDYRTIATSSFNNKSFMKVITETVRVTNNLFNSAADYTPCDLIDQDSFIVICQRGVDPYSPKYITQVGLGRIFGKQNCSDLEVTIPLRLNIPIQNANDSRNTVCYQHNLAVDNNTPQYGLNLFYPSYVFTPDPTDYVPYSTNKLNLYSALDFDTNYVIKSTIPALPNFNSIAVTSRTSNPPTTPPDPAALEVWGAIPNSLFSTGSNNVNKYTEYESIVGGSYMFYQPLGIPGVIGNLALYYSKIYDTTTPPIQMNNYRNIIVRSDRLPCGDNYATATSVGIDRVLLLQQNSIMKIYVQTPMFDSPSLLTGGLAGSNGGTLPPENPDDPNILSTFDCAGLRQLGCYQQGAGGFSIIVDPSCTPNSDGPPVNHIKNGCYTFMKYYKFQPFRNRGPILDFFRWDAKNYFEYFFRLRLNFALCQDVFGTMFHNNWVNGNLYAFPLKINTYYNSLNQVSKRDYPMDIAVLHDDTNNFYYRSSPYDKNIQGFVGKFNAVRNKGANLRNIKYPTTIMNLGPKYAFLNYVVLSKEFLGYNIDKIDFTSYKDLEDIINLFVITRIINPNFSTVAFGTGKGSITNFYSRPNYDRSLRYFLDGDGAQAMAINSQLGVIPFDESFYTNTGPSPSIVVQSVGSAGLTVMGIFFISSEDDKQVRDYVSPMREIIGQNFAGAWFYETIPHKTQLVPNYRWQIEPDISIFGTQYNDWEFNLLPNGGFYSQGYQDFDRLSDEYVSTLPTPSNDQSNYLGYLTNNLNQPSISVATLLHNPGIVGAPWYFYFGLMKGNTALNKFYTKYVGNENINE